MIIIISAVVYNQIKLYYQTGKVKGKVNIVDIVISNANKNYIIDDLIKKAIAYEVDGIELQVDYNYLLKLEGLHGDQELLRLKKKLNQADISLYGFCLYTDFNMDQDIMMAKKCVNLLNKLEGKNLRIIMNPAPEESIIASTYKSIIAFLNSVARFSAFSAGGGEGETIITLSYDILSQHGFDFDDILRIDNALKMNNVGVNLNQNNAYDCGVYKEVIAEVNGFEFNLNEVVIQSQSDLEKVRSFLQEVSGVYDGPAVIELIDEDSDKLGKVLETAENIKYAEDVIDFSKVSYPSSVARIFKKYGTAQISPSAEIEAGAIGTWTYTFDVGPQGIKEGGGLMLTFHHSTDWESFQLDNPEASGYVSVELPDDVKYIKKLTNKDACVFVHIILTEGQLDEGDQIKIIIGDTSGGARGSRAQTWQQKDFYFFSMVDATGYGHYFEQPDPARIRITGGKAEKIIVYAPSVVYSGEKFDVGVRVEDCFHNVASNYESELQLKLNGKIYKDTIYEMTNNNPAVVRFKNISINREGEYILEVIDDSGLVGTSNYINCTADEDEYRVFWGDLHCHLGYMDSVGTVPDFYNYAKNISFLDFVCHSEHMDSYSMGRQASNNLQWDIIKKGTAAYNEPGEFVTLLGYENSEIWDANVYFPGDDAPWHVDSFADRLFDFARENQALVIPHMTTYPQRKRGYDWSNYDPEVMPVVEIYSGHGSSEYFGGERPLSNCEPGGYVVEALDRCYKLGFIGSSDGHDCMPGNSPWGKYMNGLVAVFTRELSREAVFAAICKRRCYATTNSRILGYFYINGQMMGSEIKSDRSNILNISVKLYGTGSIENVDIVRNGEIIYSISGNGRKLTFDYKDTPEKSGHNYYYVRMKQKDGEMAWLSPIFVDVK